MEKKTCKTCGRTLPLDDFPITDKKHGYRRASCRDCERERKRKWKEDHKERSEKNYQAWKKKNKCHLQKYMKEYNKRRSEAQKEYKREHWLKNRERYIQRKHEDYYEHREEILAQKRKVYHYNRRYKNLSREQQEKLFNENLGLAYHMANKYFVREGSYASFNDLEQHALLGLWNGIKGLNRYNPKRCTLSTFLGLQIQGELSQFINKVAANSSGLSASVNSAGRSRKLLDMPEEEMSKKDKEKLVLASSVMRLDKPIDDGSGSETTLGELIGADEDEFYDGMADEVRKLLNVLDEEERRILCLYYGIGCESKNSKQQGRDAGVSGQTILNRLNAALDKLRNTPGVENLAIYLQS